MMGKDGMRWPYLLLMMLMLLELPCLEAAAPAVLSPVLKYDCVVGNDGSASLSAAFGDSRATGSEIFWMLVPKNESEYRTTVISGDVNGMQITAAYMPGGGEYVFYSNLSVQYVGPLEFNVKWNISYAALIVEPDALFFSPAIASSPGTQMEFRVVLPSTMTQVTQTSDAPISRENTTLVFSPTNHDRIGISFKVSGSSANTLVESSHFQFDVPERYESIAERLLAFYENASRTLDLLFNTSLSSVKIEFFVPASLEDLSTAGFTPIESAYRLGTIFLNIFYVRTETGYMEAIAAHELVHHYLAVSGISPDVLWFHEGMANYIGIKISELSGLGGASMIDGLMQAASSLTDGNYTFIFSWTPVHSDQRYTLYQHYAVAYWLTSTLAQEFSTPSDRFIQGQAFFTSLFTNIRRLSMKISDDDTLARMMYASANFSKAAFATLVSLGFNVKPVFVPVNESTSQLGSVTTYLLTLVLGKPIDSALEIAASSDISTALTMMSEASDFFANFDTSLLILLLLIGTAMIMMLQKEDGNPVQPPV
jgi:hypothetical protein